MKYFLKENVGSHLLDKNGRPFPFETLGGGYGVIALDEANPDQNSQAEQLQKIANSHTLGIVSITEGEYGSKKREYPFTPSVMRYDEVRVFNPPRNLPAPAGNVAAVSAPASAPQPIIPTEAPPVVAFKPRQGRLNVSAQKALDALQSGKAA